jgi:hypothetical protein
VNPTVGLEEVWGRTDLGADVTWDFAHHLRSSAARDRRKEVINRIGFVLGRSCRICLLKPSNSLGKNSDASAPEYWKKAVRDPPDPLRIIKPPSDLILYRETEDKVLFRLSILTEILENKLDSLIQFRRCS